jgi:hypothetical protein
MAYASAVKGSWSLPAKYGWFLAGWAYLNTRFNETQAGEKLRSGLHILRC